LADSQRGITGLNFADQRRRIFPVDRPLSRRRPKPWNAALKSMLQ
jgi:hypothetical protein